MPAVHSVRRPLPPKTSRDFLLRILLVGIAFMSPHLAWSQTKYILIDGSSTVYPVSKVAAQEFNREWDNTVKIDVSFSGTSGGFRKFLAGETDLIGASRPINREEIKKARDYKIKYIEIPIAYDALTIAVHPSNTRANDIKLSELRKIWESAAEGKVTRWSQIRPEWPDTEIKLFGAGKDSGTYDYFVDVVVGSDGSLRSDYTASEDDDAIIRGIESHPGALGFIPFAYFTKEGDKLKSLGVQWDFDASTGQSVSGAPTTQPSHDAVLRGIYMPFGRPLFLYVNLKSLEAKPHLKEFLQYYLIHADIFVDRVHYLSLPRISYARAIADLETKKIGTRFFGKPEVGLNVNDLITRRPR